MKGPNQPQESTGYARLLWAIAKGAGRIMVVLIQLELKPVGKKNGLAARRICTKLKRGPGPCRKNSFHCLGKRPSPTGAAVLFTKAQAVRIRPNARLQKQTQPTRDAQANLEGQIVKSMNPKPINLKANFEERPNPP